MKRFDAGHVMRWKTTDGCTMAKIITSGTSDLVDSPLDWMKRGLQETSSGYGGKLTSAYKVSFCGKLYRLYSTCYSNLASHWFTVKGEKIFVD